MTTAQIPGLFLVEPVDAAEAARWTTAEERQTAAAFPSQRRRAEYLSWRTVVRRLLGADVQIGYNEIGAPVLKNRNLHIGVAHCEGRIAVCISERPCAVDIEPEGRDFRRAASRYLAPEERALSGDELLPAAVWCAKETLYKYSGRTELDLLRDIRILQVDVAVGTIRGRIENGEPIALTLLRRDGFIVVCRL